MKTLRFAASTLDSVHSQPFQVPSAPSSQAHLPAGAGLLSMLWRWFKDKQVARSNTKRLQVTSSVSLGEKRFVAVVQVDGRQFLVGGGATGVSLLAQLDKKESFDHLLNKSMSGQQESIAEPAAEQTRKLA